MTNECTDDQLQRLATNIPGFDAIAAEGLPAGSTTLVAGTAGSAKTVFAAQFVAEGIRRGESGVFVTLEEAAEDIRRNMATLGWDVERWEQQGKWAFVDAALRPGEEALVTGGFDLGALVARIENAVIKVRATRLSIDSLGAIFIHFTDRSVVRRELFRIAAASKQLGVTALMTAERTVEYGDIARFGVEEFVTDNVVILRNVLEEEKRRRTVEVLKLRGSNHKKGECPFTIMPGKGIIVMPLSAIELKQRSSNVRITSGNAALDSMCGGGFFRDSIILVSGATGCGKTLMTNEFISGGANNGERCLLLAFEESRDQLFRNAAGWGQDFEKFEADGNLKVIAVYPETASLEDHLIAIKSEIDAFKPDRVAVDSLSALERVSATKSFHEFAISLTSFIKHREITGLFTATTESLMGGSSIAESHICTIADSIVLLRYVEMFGEMRRGLTVLKMRGSMHDKDIREFEIDHQGMHVGNAFRNVVGILTGRTRRMASAEWSA